MYSFAAIMALLHPGRMLALVPAKRTIAAIHEA
jgi:hypothetical protein